MKYIDKRTGRRIKAADFKNQNKTLLIELVSHLHMIYTFYDRC